MINRDIKWQIADIQIQELWHKFYCHPIYRYCIVGRLVRFPPLLMTHFTQWILWWLYACCSATHSKSCSSLPWGVPQLRHWKSHVLTVLCLSDSPPLRLSHRQAWALVSVIGGGNSSCSEDIREHENHDTGGRAFARRNFTTADGVRFAVTAYSEWKNGEEERACASGVFASVVWKRVKRLMGWEVSVLNVYFLLRCHRLNMKDILGMCGWLFRDCL